jgi:hypothetical protein
MSFKPRPTYSCRFDYQNDVGLDPHYVVLSIPVTGSFLGPIISLTTPFQNTLRPRCSITISDHVSHPHKTKQQAMLEFCISSSLYLRIAHWQTKYPATNDSKHSLNLIVSWFPRKGRDSLVGIAIGYGLDGPDRPWGPPSLLYTGYRVFRGGKAAGAWC